MAVFAAISGSWFVMLALKQGWQPVVDFFLTENLGRFSHVDFGPQRGPFYYVGVFMTEFSPWSFLFPVAGLEAWRRSRAKRGQPHGEAAGAVGNHGANHGVSSGDTSHGDLQRDRLRPYLLLGLWMLLAAAN